jgi:hypothetical protein
MGRPGNGRRGEVVEGSRGERKGQWKTRPMMGNRNGLRRRREGSWEWDGRRWGSGGGD